MRKLQSVVLLVVLLAGISYSTAFASELQSVTEIQDEGYQIEYFDTQSGKAARFELLKELGRGLLIQNRIAYISAESKSYEKLAHTLTVKLQESKDGQSWSTIKTYTASTNNATSCSIDESYAVTKGYFYRLEVTIQLDNGEMTEDYTATTSAKECYDLM